MKTMRYRIRVIALAMVCALLAVVIWTARTAWFPGGIGMGPTVPPAASAAPSDPDPWADPTTAPSEDLTDLPEETPSAEPLFVTFGL